MSLAQMLFADQFIRECADGFVALNPNNGKLMGLWPTRNRARSVVLEEVK